MIVASSPCLAKRRWGQPSTRQKEGVSQSQTIFLKPAWYYSCKVLCLRKKYDPLEMKRKIKRANFHIFSSVFLCPKLLSWMAVFWLWKAFLDVGGPIRIGNELVVGAGVGVLKALWKHILKRISTRWLSCQTSKFCIVNCHNWLNELIANL